MKKIISLIIFTFILSCFNLGFAAPDEQTVISSFQEVIQKHLDSYQDDPRIMVYYVPSDTYWIKSKCIVSNDYTYDIQKTNSIITPYTGYFIYKMRISTIDKQPTKEAAEAFNTFNKNGDRLPVNCRITFSYQGDKWIPQKYEIQSLISDKWYDVTNDTSDAVMYQRILIKK